MFLFVIGNECSKEYENGCIYLDGWFGGLASNIDTDGFLWFGSDGSVEYRFINSPQVAA